MDRAEKEKLVTAFNQAVVAAGVIVVSHYKGLKVGEMDLLRGRMAEADATLRVVKNRLARLALEGTPAEGIKDLFTGPTVVAMSGDPVAAPRVLCTFATDNDNLVILGGAIGPTVLDSVGVKSLANLASLDELRVGLVGMISTPAKRMAGALQAPAGQLARLLNAYATRDEAA
ncbi:MAG: 50S ribosomal protein L10 [Hyphomicrobiales bacterium]